MYLGILITTLENQNNLLTNVNGASSKEKWGLKGKMKMVKGKITLTEMKSPQTD